jgi:nucleoside-diphosphate-sugar epimerase
VKAFVSGNHGFLGRHFTRTLVERGWTVEGCDVARRRGLVLPDDDARWWFQHCNDRFDLVVHCAAVEPHRAAIDGQPMHLARNLQLDSAMFDWAVRTGQGRVLYLSSSAAYPVAVQSAVYAKVHAEDGRDWTMPEGLAGAGLPDADYGWCKLTGERMAEAARAAGVPVTVVRPFSGYGEDQDERWPFGAFAVRARRREDPFVIWGDGTQVRDWIHVSDLVDGALTLVDNGVDGPVNLCTGVGTSMRDLVTLMCTMVGYSPRVELRPDMPAGVAYRVGDPTLMQRWYTPEVSLVEGVKRALA